MAGVVSLLAEVVVKVLAVLVTTMSLVHSPGGAVDSGVMSVIPCVVIISVTLTSVSEVVWLSTGADSTVQITQRIHIGEPHVPLHQPTVANSLDKHIDETSIDALYDPLQ